MEMVLLAHEAVTPGGKPVGVPMLVALTVACVSDVKAVLTHTREGPVAGATDMMVIVPEAVPQPPVKVAV